MTAIEFIRMGLETSKAATLGLIEDMKDAPLTQPTAKGGNHPLWILGHLAYSEANVVNHIILGNENPLIHWKGLFGDGGEPVADAARYPSMKELTEAFDVARSNTLGVLDGLAESDLDQPSKNCPPDREAFFGTIGKCFLILTLHPAMHRGQVADARRVLGRQPLVA